MNPFWLTLANVFGFLLVFAALGWLAWHALRNSEEPGRLLGKWLATAVIVIGLGLFARHYLSGDSGAGLVAGFGAAALIAGTIAFGGIVLAMIWGSQMGAWIAKPFTELFDGGAAEAEAQPLYAIAEARRKQGRYLEAVREVRQQLDRFPADVTGWLLLAEIEAEDLKDLPSATATIERLVALPEHRPGTVAPALNRLADWHLKLGQDPDSARAALERILELFPGTEQAHLTAQRLAHLASPEWLAEQREPHKLKLGQYEQRVGLRETPLDTLRTPDDPTKEAADLVRHLERHADDNEARERLAMIYAAHYHRLDLAVEQMEQLIAQPQAPTRQVVRWLTELAELQAKHGGDFAAARRTLERIVERYPGSAAAGMAERHLVHLGVPERTQTRRPFWEAGGSPERKGSRNGG